MCFFRKFSSGPYKPGKNSPVSAVFCAVSAGVPSSFVRAWAGATSSIALLITPGRPGTAASTFSYSGQIAPCILIPGILIVGVLDIVVDMASAVPCGGSSIALLPPHGTFLGEARCSASSVRALPAVMPAGQTTDMCSSCISSISARSSAVSVSMGPGRSASPTEIARCVGMPSLCIRPSLQSPYCGSSTVAWEPRLCCSRCCCFCCRCVVCSCFVCRCVVCGGLS